MKRKIAWFWLSLVLAAPLSSFPSHAETSSLSPERQKIVHVLNRLGYGPRPGDIERVETMGLDKYIQLQLYPERIHDLAVEKKLAALDTLEMSAATLTGSFEEARKEREERQRARAKEQKQAENPSGSPQTTPASARSAETGRNRMNRMEELLSHPSARAVSDLQTAKIIRAVESERQLTEVLVDFWGNHFNIDAKKGPCRVLKTIDDREVIRPHVFGKFRDLLEASAKSPAMLFYLDNVQNSVERTVSPAEQRIRQQMIEQVTGNADSPEAKARKVGGVNENYAREIMELHTLGVDGGYTQKDVQEVARCFTGWGMNRRTGGFVFETRRHDDGSKTVLGFTMPAGGGIKDGMKVIDLLSRHPSTAKFISQKLCQRFVSDAPPTALVARVAQVCSMTDGDLRKVYEVIFHSPEFWSAEAYRAKIKSPFEFAVSAVRATGGTVTLDTSDRAAVQRIVDGRASLGGGDRVANQSRKSLNLHITAMGQPLFGYTAPTGYPEVSHKWVNTGALISRLNFAMALTGRSVSDASVNIGELLKGVDIDNATAVSDRLLKALLQGDVSPETRNTLAKQSAGNQSGMATTVNVAQLAALILGSPEFQRH